MCQQYVIIIDIHLYITMKDIDKSHSLGDSKGVAPLVVLLEGVGV